MSAPHITIVTAGCPYRVTERDSGRAYTVIGEVCTPRGPIPILIPDEIALGEPLPIKAERVRPRPTLIPEGM
jgi:hypothetical protein